MIIGLSGLNAVGKGTVAQLLQEKGFAGFSLSEVIREELRRKKQMITRPSLIKMGNTLRRRYGAEILAERIISRVNPAENIVVDSFRNPAEVKAFRRFTDFYLFWIDAKPRIRFQRLFSRNRPGDPKSFAEFRKLEERELSGDIEQQQLLHCRRMANIYLDNNGSRAKLAESLNRILRRLFLDMSRPSWDEYFLRIAQVVASRSNCIKRKVAAVIVKDGRLISTGYNGTPRGIRNCNAGGCPRCNNYIPSGKQLDECYCSHGEENAIVQSAYHGISIKGATIYTTYSPCLICTKMIINSGIKEVVYNQSYALRGDSLRLLREARIKIRKVQLP